MLKQDQDADGLLDEFQLAEALKGTPCQMSAEEARKLMEGLPKSVAPSFSGAPTTCVCDTSRKVWKETFNV